MTKIIGLTGGIGSGKTTVAKLFAAKGIPVYIADDEAKKIMKLPETINSIKAVFGKNVIENGLVNTKTLASIVFNNTEKLKLLNSIIHPLVKQHFDQWVKLNKHNTFVIKESAILFESGSYQYCDKIITVIASESTRISRVMQRDSITKEEILARIKNQWNDDERIKKSDYVIENEDLEDTKKQFEHVLNSILKHN
jgi:dephospho-CoA kinase